MIIYEFADMLSAGSLEPIAGHTVLPRNLKDFQLVFLHLRSRLRVSFLR